MSRTVNFCNYAMSGLGTFLGLVDERARLKAECFGNFINIEECKIFLSPLNHSDVGAVKISAFGEGLL